MADPAPQIGGPRVSIAVPDLRMLHDSGALVDSTGMRQYRNRRPHSATIDWSHPLSRGIVAYVLGPNCDLASRLSTNSNEVCDTGIGFRYYGGDAYIKYKPQRISTQFTATILLPHYPYTGVLNPRPLFNFGRSSGRIYGECMAVLNHDTLSVGFWDDGYKMRIDASQDAVTGGCGVNICVSFDQDGGMYAASSACPMGTASPNGGSLRADIGEIGSDSRDSRIADEITAFIVHNRALTLPEVHRMSRNPYQMLRGL